jgi:hypothetical protein
MAVKPKSQALEIPTCEDRLLWDVLSSRMHIPALVVADQAGLFSLLATGPATGSEIARQLTLRPRKSEALLALLAALGFLNRQHERFSLTNVSRNFLLPESPYSWVPVLQSGRESSTAVRLWQTLRGEQPGAKPDKASEKSLTRWWKAPRLDRATAKRVTEHMHAYSFPAAMGLVRWADFREVKRLLDVGGGSGCFSIALALRHPKMRCTILELPAISRLSARYVNQYGLKHRIDTRPMNMFKDTWPDGHDAVFFSNVFHDWDRETCAFLGRRSFDALPAGGRLYVHEILLADSKDGPLAAASFSMNILLTTDGQQFTSEELEDLLEECGFVDVSVAHSYGYFSLVSARKPLDAPSSRLRRRRAAARQHPAV